MFKQAGVVQNEAGGRDGPAYATNTSYLCVGFNDSLRLGADKVLCNTIVIPYTAICGHYNKLNITTITNMRCTEQLAFIDRMVKLTYLMFAASVQCVIVFYSYLVLWTYDLFYYHFILFQNQQICIDMTNDMYQL